MGKGISFYDYMRKYPHEDPDRVALAADLARLAPLHKEIKKIDSLVALMKLPRLLKDQNAKKAVTGDLWCEYCAACNRPVEWGNE